MNKDARNEWKGVLKFDKKNDNSATNPSQPPVNTLPKKEKIFLTEEIDLSSSTGHLIKHRLNNENHESKTNF